MFRICFISLFVFNSFFIAQNLRYRCFDDENFLVNCNEAHSYYRIYDDENLMFYKEYYVGKDTLLKLEMLPFKEDNNPNSYLLKTYHKNNINKCNRYPTKEDCFYSNGKKAWEKRKENNVTKFINAWDKEGNAIITNGNGYLSKEASELAREGGYNYGKVKNGLKEGEWYSRASEIFPEYLSIFKEGIEIQRFLLDSTGMKTEIDIDIEKEKEFYKKFNEEVTLQVHSKLSNLNIEEDCTALVKLYVSESGELINYKISNTIPKYLYDALDFSLKNVKIRADIMQLRSPVLFTNPFFLPVTFKVPEEVTRVDKKELKKKKRELKKAIRNN